MKPVHVLRLVATVALVVTACSGQGSAATSSPAPRGSTGGAGSAPLGAWMTTITEADFTREGLTEAAANEENGGTFTFTLNADGTFTETQQADHPIRFPVFRGTWSDQGNGQLELRTTFPPDFVGEVIVVTWAMDGGNVQFRLVSPEEPYLRTHFQAHPWSPAP